MGYSLERDGDRMDHNDMTEPSTYLRGRFWYFGGEIAFFVLLFLSVFFDVVNFSAVEESIGKGIDGGDQMTLLSYSARTQGIMAANQKHEATTELVDSCLKSTITHSSVVNQ